MISESGTQKKNKSTSDRCMNATADFVECLWNLITRRPLFELFLHFFFILFFYNDYHQQVSKREPQNSQKSQKSEKLTIKTHSQSTLAKRLYLERAKPLKLTTVTQFWRFFQSSRTPKITSKLIPKWSLRVPKITKNRKNKHSKNIKK